MNEVSTEKTMTVKELSLSLGVSDETIRSTAKLLFDPSKLIWRVINGGKALVFTELQSTAIKIELQNHSKIAQNGFTTLTISNDLEAWELSKRLDAYKDMRIAELTKQNEYQKQQLIEQQPKVNFAEKITADEHSTFDMAHVAQELKLPYGKNILFNNLREKSILKSDNTPYQQYVDIGYFKVYAVSTPVGTKLTTKVTQRGIAFIGKILNKEEGK